MTSQLSPPIPVEGGGRSPSRTGRITLRVEEAARDLGVSRDFFEERIEPNLKVLRVGRIKLIPVHELARYVSMQARLPFEDYGL